MRVQQSMLHSFGSSSDTAHLRGHAAVGERRFRGRQTGLVNNRTCTFAELAAAIRARTGPVRIVGIDGCGGAGKTTFAARLSRALGDPPIVHTDDFATHDEMTEWWPCMLRDVVEPLLRGAAASYRPYDWVKRSPAATITTVEPADIVLIEGVGAMRKAWRDLLTLRVWVDCPRDLRLARGIARDGEQLREFWRQWMAAEDTYVATEQPYRHADVIVDGAASALNRESQYVALPQINEPR